MPDMDTDMRAGAGRTSGGQDPALSVREAALQAGVNERTIRRAITDGRLRAAQVSGAYRIDAEDLQSWIDNRRAPAGTSAGPSDTRAGSPDTPGEHPPDAWALIARLESEVTFLRETLSAEVEARRRADILVAGLMERLPEIAATASQDAPEPPGRVDSPRVDDSTLQSSRDVPVPASEGLWQRLWRAISGR